MAILKGLSPEKIREIQAQPRRTKGDYNVALADFLESDEAGVNPHDAWPTIFGSRSAATMRQSFGKLIETEGLKDIVELRVIDDTLFLVHKERWDVLVAELDANDTQE